MCSFTTTALSFSFFLFSLLVGDCCGCCHMHRVRATQAFQFQLVDKPHWHIVNEHHHHVISITTFQKKNFRRAVGTMGGPAGWSMARVGLGLGHSAVGARPGRQKPGSWGKGDGRASAAHLGERAGRLWLKSLHRCGRRGRNPIQNVALDLKASGPGLGHSASVRAGRSRAVGATAMGGAPRHT